MKPTFTVIFLAIVVFSYSQKSAVSNGNWSTASVWSPSGVPTVTDNVIISSGRTVTITSNVLCKDLQVGGSASGRLVFGGFAGRTVNVAGNVLVAANGTFQVPTNAFASHSVYVSGSYSNAGVTNFNGGTFGKGLLFFKGNGNATLSGNGPLNIYKLNINLGNGITNVFSLTATSGTYASNFLTLNNGTFKISTSQSVTLVPYTGSVSLPASTGLWMDAPGARMSFSALVQFAGKITVEDGYFDVGNGANEDLVSVGGTLAILGGTLDISGKYNGSSGANTFSMTGGQMVLPSVSTNNKIIAPFSLSGANSHFDMDGGVIVIRREGGAGAQDLGFVNTGVTNGAVTGGTLQVGDASTPASQTIGVNASYPLPHIVVNSPNATVKVTVNSMTTTGNISINSGTLIANNLDITLSGNWYNAGKFIPGTGTVRFVSAQNQSIQNTSTETFGNVLFSGGYKNVLTPLSTNGNFSVASGVTVDLSASDYSLGVKGNLVNNGSLALGNNSVILNGSTNQQINGTSGYAFYDLVLNNTNGFKMNTDATIRNTLNMNNGLLNINSQSLTLLSDANGTARIPPITGSGAIAGAITVQRFAPGGSTGWTTLGTPINSGTFQDWDDDIAITCLSCPDGYNNFTSIYTYSEAAAGTFSSPSSYIPLSNISSPMAAGTGYFVFLGTSLYTTSDITMDMTGVVTTGNKAIQLQYHNSGSAADDGWNLIANPYPSPISWAALRNGSTTVDNAIYVYNPDLNAGTGGYASYVNSISSPNVVSGGIGNDIPIGQGFMVHATAPVTLSASETIKSVGAQPLLKTAAHNPAVVRVQLNGPYGFSDECVVYEQIGATEGFDTDYDAWEVQSQNIYAPRIFLQKDSLEFQINGIQPVSGTYSTGLALFSAYPGGYTISASISDLPNGYCVRLYDRFTNAFTDLRGDSAAFIFEDSTSVSRFVLSIIGDDIPVKTGTTQPDCTNQNGMISVNPQGYGMVAYAWRDGSGQIIKSVAHNGADTLRGLSSGLYSAEIIDAAVCASASRTFMLYPPTLPKAGFDFPDPVYAGITNLFLDLSTGADSWHWTFGDGAFSEQISPDYAYKQIGIYTVMLVVSSAEGCTDTMKRVIHVLEPDQTKLPELYTGQLRLRSLSNNYYVLDLENRPEPDQWILCSAHGEIMRRGAFEEESSIDFDLSDLSPGIYIVSFNRNSLHVKLTRN